MVAISNMVSKSAGGGVGWGGGRKEMFYLMTHILFSYMVSHIW